MLLLIFIYYRFEEQVYQNRWKQYSNNWSTRLGKTRQNQFSEDVKTIEYTFLKK